VLAPGEKIPGPIELGPLTAILQNQGREFLEPPHVTGGTQSRS
jgi:hypothetical protein